MKNGFTKEDKKKIKDTIRIKYSEVSVTPENLFQYPTGLAGLKALNYDRDIVRSLPESVTSSFCGAGNPFSLGKINFGEKLLDIGCGGGVDTMVAALMVGSTGQVIGIDISAQMLERAQKNLHNAALKNIAFDSANPEDLPFPDQFFEVVISNGVFNLIPDKTKALAEVFRVLKPGGRFMIADQILFGASSKDINHKIASWAN